MCGDVNVPSHRIGEIWVGFRHGSLPSWPRHREVVQIRPGLSGVLLMPLRGREEERKLSGTRESQERAEVEKVNLPGGHPRLWEERARESEAQGLGWGGSCASL